MKAVLLFTSLFLAFPCLADCSKEAQVAAGFMNRYLAYLEDVVERRSEQSVSDWLAADGQAAPEFVAAYRQLEAEGYAHDPEMGWGVDLLLDAQDHPDQGFALAACSEEPGVVILRGVDWPQFEVAVRVSPSAQGNQVLGAGLVNVPEHARASRSAPAEDE